MKRASPLKTILFGFATSAVLPAAGTFAHEYPEAMIRTPADETPFVEFFPGISVYPLHGAFAAPGPHFHHCEQRSCDQH